MNKRAFAVLAVCASTALGAAVLPAQSATATDTPATGGVELRVASFNIKNVTFDSNRGASRPWAERRKVIIKAVLDEKIDVLGIQEANHSRYNGIDYPDGANQYLDLKNGLNKAGGAYRLTSAASFNCRNGKTARGCVYKKRGASRGTRILYDTRRLELVERGSVLYKRQDSTGVDRWLAWAVLRVKETGQTVFVGNTHLSNGASEVKLAQWRQLVRKTNKLKGSSPVVITGDFNVQKYHPVAEQMLPRMSSAGYGDTLGQEYGVNRGPARPLSTTDAWINSFNHNRIDVTRFSQYLHRERTGSMIDWIFASNELVVQHWGVVLDYDPERMRVNGVLPSDHNMIEATLTLP